MRASLSPESASFLVFAARPIPSSPTHCDHTPRREPGIKSGAVSVALAQQGDAIERVWTILTFPLAGFDSGDFSIG